MRTDDFRPSDNVEDNREARGGIPGGAGGLGIGTIVIVGLISWYFGIDPSVLLNGAQILTGGTSSQQSGTAPPVTTGTPNDATGKFVALVLGDTEDTWKEIFAASGRTYHPPKLRLFSGAEQGGCGLARSAMGPFYCPNDQRIYLDTAFFNDLQNKFGGCDNNSACKFSEAYVIAHEVGHHVQNLIGATRLPTRGETPNQTSVRVELQADCFAGVWGHTARSALQITDEDLAEALTAAHAIGDDTLGHSDERTFTHGSSEQRMRWFRRGFDSGDARQCDTFAVQNHREL